MFWFDFTNFLCQFLGVYQWRDHPDLGCFKKRHEITLPSYQYPRKNQWFSNIGRCPNELQRNHGQCDFEAAQQTWNYRSQIVYLWHWKKYLEIFQFCLRTQWYWWYICSSQFSSISFKVQWLFRYEIEFWFHDFFYFFEYICSMYFDFTNFS